MTVLSQEDPFINGEYGYWFTKGFQEGEGQSGHGSSDIEQQESRFTTSYWKANVVAKHYVACKYQELPLD